MHMSGSFLLWMYVHAQNDAWCACQEFNVTKCNKFLCFSLLNVFVTAAKKRVIVANGESWKRTEGSPLYHRGQIFFSISGIICISHEQNTKTNHCLVWTLILSQMSYSSDVPSVKLTDWSVYLFTPWWMIWENSGLNCQHTANISSRAAFGRERSETLKHVCMYFCVCACVQDVCILSDSEVSLDLFAQGFSSCYLSLQL